MNPVGAAISISYRNSVCAFLPKTVLPTKILSLSLWTCKIHLVNFAKQLPLKLVLIYRVCETQLDICIGSERRCYYHNWLPNWGFEKRIASPCRRGSKSRRKFFLFNSTVVSPCVFIIAAFLTFLLLTSSSSGCYFAKSTCIRAIW